MSQPRNRVFIAQDKNDLSTLALQVMQSVPVNLQLLADHAGIALRSSDMKDDLRISRRNGVVTIETRETATEEEQRYLAAFALAYMVDPDGRKEFSDLLKSRKFALSHGKTGALELVGGKADRRARALMQELLMPRDVVTMLYKSGVRDIRQLAALCRVSCDMMERRIVALQKNNILPAYSIQDIRRVRNATMDVAAPKPEPQPARRAQAPSDGIARRRLEDRIGRRTPVPAPF